MDASAQLMRKPMRRQQQVHHLLLVGSIFLMAATISFVFAIISHEAISLHNNGLPNVAFPNSRSLVTPTMSIDKQSMSLNKRRSDYRHYMSSSARSCFTIYISEQDVDDARPTEESPNRSTANIVINRFLREGKVPEGSSIVLVTEDESVFNATQQMPKAGYRWTVLHHKPSFINFLDTLNDMRQAVQCDTIIHSNAKRSRFLLLLFGSLKSTGRSFRSILVNIREKALQPPKTAILHMKAKNQSLRKQKKSEIGFRLCQFFSGTREGLCDRWFR